METSEKTLADTILDEISLGYIDTIRSRIERDDRTLNEQVIECLKYLAIVSMTPGRRIPVTPEVDDVWHELIVQTKPYSRLCADLPGGEFIHHESITPVVYAERVGGHEFVAEFVQWIPDYVHNFGEFTEESAQHWTVCAFLRTTMGLSLDQINHLGRENQPAVIIPQESRWTLLSAPSE